MGTTIRISAGARFWPVSHNNEISKQSKRGMYGHLEVSQRNKKHWFPLQHDIKWPMSPLEFGTSWKEPQLQLVIAREVHQNPEPQHFWQDGLDPSQSQPCRSEPETMFNLIIFWGFDGFAIYHLEPTETEKILAGYHQDDWPWYETIEKQWKTYLPGEGKGPLVLPQARCQSPRRSVTAGVSLLDSTRWLSYWRLRMGGSLGTWNLSIYGFVWK